MKKTLLYVLAFVAFYEAITNPSSSMHSMYAGIVGAIYLSAAFVIEELRK